MLQNGTTAPYFECKDENGNTRWQRHCLTRWPWGGIRNEEEERGIKGDNQLEEKPRRPTGLF